MDPKSACIENLAQFFLMIQVSRAQHGSAAAEISRHLESPLAQKPIFILKRVPRSSCARGTVAPKACGTSLLDGTDCRAEGLLVVLLVQGRSMRTTPSLQGESFMSKGCFWFISFGYRAPCILS